MDRLRTVGILAAVGLMLAACASQSVKPLVDPFPLRFPLVEAGTLEIEGHIVGQPRVADGIIFFATREGYLTAAVASTQAVLWRFKADHALSMSPEINGPDTTLLRDDAGTIYVLNGRGKGDGFDLDVGIVATTPVRLIEGGYVFGTAAGRIISLQSWEYRPPGPASGITCGPSPVWRDGWLKSILFGRSDGLIMALSAKGAPLWEFRAAGAIQADPAAAGGRVYFGDAERMFYCLDAASGKVKWRRRLQGAALHPAIIKGGTVAVPASNSVVYLLSRKGGSILSWEAVPSRVIYELAAAGGLALITSASPTIVALDLRTGKRAGQFEASGPLVAGAVWSPPYVVLFIEDEDSGRQRLVFLRSR
jgi:outer membrane protein assembly factor BamB